MNTTATFTSPTALRVAALRDFCRAWRQVCACSLESAGVRAEGARLECGGCGSTLIRRRDAAPMPAVAPTPPAVAPAALIRPRGAPGAATRERGAQGPQSTNRDALIHGRPSAHTGCRAEGSR